MSAAAAWGRQCGGQVEVASLTSESALVLVNPDGTRTGVLHAGTERVKRVGLDWLGEPNRSFTIQQATGVSRRTLHGGTEARETAIAWPPPARPSTPEAP